MKNGKRIIVSMTSWLKRIENVCPVLKSILKQSMMPDLIELNLSLLEFPGRTDDLPVDLKNIVTASDIIEINWEETNDYSFKKIIPTLKKFYGEDYYLVSIDDDFIYKERYIEKLVTGIEETHADTYNLGNAVIYGNRQIYKSTCFASDFWENLTQEVIDTKHDDLYIYYYLCSKNKNMYTQVFHEINDYMDMFNSVYSISDNGIYDNFEIKDAINKIIKTLNKNNNNNNMQYLKRFNTTSEQQQYSSTVDFISYIRDIDAVKIDYPDFSKLYFSIVPLQDCRFKFETSKKYDNTQGKEVPANESIKYSLDKGKTWIELESSYDDHIVYGPNVSANTMIMFKGELRGAGQGPYADIGIGQIHIIDNSDAPVQYNVSGNVMSLLYEDQFQTATQISPYMTLQGLFSGSSVVNAKDLILPATSLSAALYMRMFYGCTSLISAPALPATSLTDSCYSSMFYGCTSLTTAPVLPATTLAVWCYKSMFMNCTSLNYIKMMATEINSNHNHLTNWVSGVGSTGTFVKNESATWTTTGVSGVPTGWTVETATE